MKKIRSDKGKKHNMTKKSTGYINIAGSGLKVAKITYYKARKGTISREKFIEGIVKASGGPSQFSAEDIYARLNSADLAGLTFDRYNKEIASISRRKSFWAADDGLEFAANAFKSSMQEIINKMPDEVEIGIKSALNSTYINFMDWKYNPTKKRLETYTDDGKLVWVKVSEDFTGDYEEDSVKYGVE